MSTSFTEAVARHLLVRAGEWVDGRDLARIGGAYAWRSRVSDARRQYGLRIENRQRRITEGRDRVVISEYRVVLP